MIPHNRTRQWLLGAILGSTLVLSGCAPTVWGKPGLTQQQWMTERYQCEKDARQSQYFGGGLAGAINMRNFFNQCLEAHGYRRVQQ